jgi:hypothetical protein
MIDKTIKIIKTVNFDYEEGEMPFPPLHPNCRCTMQPIMIMAQEEMTILENEIENNKILSIKDVPEEKAGANESKIIEIEGVGRAIFKPIEGEDDSLLEEAGITEGTLAVREELAFLVSREMRMDNVPATTLREVKGETGSVQLWYEKGEIAAESKFTTSKPPIPYWVAKEETKMKVYDCLIQGTDRHDHNYIVDEEKQSFIYIDNGLSFVGLQEGEEEEDAEIEDIGMIFDRAANESDSEIDYQGIPAKPLFNRNEFNLIADNINRAITSPNIKAKMIKYDMKKEYKEFVKRGKNMIAEAEKHIQ